MKPKSKPKNPFYAACVVVGVAFAITACAFGVLIVQDLGKLRDASAEVPASSLMEFLDRHGVTVLIVELVLLAIVCFGAMGTEEYWTARHEARVKREKEADKTKQS